MATPKLLEAACKGTHLSQGGPDDATVNTSDLYSPTRHPGGSQ
jgi:hypothetical protein